MRISRYIAVTMLCLASMDASADEEKMQLVEQGKIKISGGCVAHMSGEITLTPNDQGALLSVDNSQGIFHGENPISSYEVQLSPKEIEEFLTELQGTLDNPVPATTISSWAAVIELNLPLDGGTLAETWRESDGKMDVYPLWRLIKSFVANHAPDQ